MALSSNEFDLELAKNTAGGIVKRVDSALSGLNAKPEKIAANVYGTGTDQQSQQTAVVQPSATEPSANNDAIVALSGTPKIRAATVQPAPQQQPFKVTLPGGMVYESGDQPRQRRFTVPGQGTGTANAGFGFNDKDKAAILAKNALARSVSTPPNTPSVQQSAVQTLAGGAADQEKSPLDISIEGLDRINRPLQTQQVAGGGIDFKNMSRQERRFAARNATIANEQGQLDVQRQNAATALARNDIDTERVGIDREQLGIARDANAIALQRLVGDNELNAARIATEGINQQKGQLDINQAQNLTKLQQQYLGEKDPAKQRLLGQQLLTMQGKDPKEWQVTTREESDPANPGLTKKVSYAVNLQDPSRVIEIGGAAMAGQNDPAMQVINGNPAYRAAYDKASPEKQAEMRKKVNERMKQVPVQ